MAGPLPFFAAPLAMKNQSVLLQILVQKLFNAIIVLDEGGTAGFMKTVPSEYSLLINYYLSIPKYTGS